MAYKRIEKKETFEITHGGDTVAVAIFLDDRFQHCKTDLWGKWSRDDWMMLSFIEKTISEIEEHKRNGKN